MILIRVFALDQSVGKRKREPSPTRKRESMCKNSEAKRSVVIEGPNGGQDVSSLVRGWGK